VADVVYFGAKVSEIQGLGIEGTGWVLGKVLISGSVCCKVSFLKDLGVVRLLEPKEKQKGPAPGRTFFGLLLI
jgi:hypothetical protein